MDPSNPLFIIAGWFGLAPSSLIAIVLLVTTLANITARLIPSDATGALGTLRTIAGIVGAYVSSRVTSGVTIEQVASSAAKTPAVAKKLDADQKENGE